MVLMEVLPGGPGRLPKKLTLKLLKEVGVSLAGAVVGGAAFGALGLCIVYCLADIHYRSQGCQDLFVCMGLAWATVAILFLFTVVGVLVGVIVFTPLSLSLLGRRWRIRGSVKRAFLGSGLAGVAIAGIGILLLAFGDDKEWAEKLIVLVGIAIPLVIVATIIGYSRGSATPG